MIAQVAWVVLVHTARGVLFDVFDRGDSAFAIYCNLLLDSEEKKEPATWAVEMFGLCPDGSFRRSAIRMTKKGSHLLEKKKPAPDSVCPFIDYDTASISTEALQMFFAEMGFPRARA